MAVDTSTKKVTECRAGGCESGWQQVGHYALFWSMQLSTTQHLLHKLQVIHELVIQRFRAGMAFGCIHCHIHIEGVALLCSQACIASFPGTC